VQQVLYGKLDKRGFSGWKPVGPSAGDQRHVAAALDAQGRLHAVWREGPAGKGAAATNVAIYYGVRDTGGSWRKPVRVSAADENASMASVAAYGNGVCVAWIAWTPGAMNSEGQRDNAYPADNSTVDGRLETASMPVGGVAFGRPSVIDPGPASYPTWARAAAGSEAQPPLLWTSTQGGNDGRVRLFMGWCAGAQH
jgi:hypothetical protein